MKTTRTKKAAVAAAGAMLMAALAAPAAYGHSASSSYYYTGGDRLEANAWIQSFSWTGCGSWTTSAKLWGNNPALASWIKNTASFNAVGLGASVSIFSASGGTSSTSLSWTNNNAWISDLAGTVCGNWLTLYIGETSVATSYVPKYGSPRTAVASL